MIKPNVIIALLLICVLLGVGFFLVQDERPTPTKTVKEGSVLINEFMPDSIKTIQLVKAGTEIKLEKKDKNWTLVSHKNRPAKNDRVEAFLNNIRDSKLISERTGSDETFSLDEKSRIEVSLLSESGKTELFLGKSPEWGKAFARTSAKGPTLEINKPLDTDASARTEGSDRVIDVQHFYDLKIINIPQDDIVEFTITRKTEKGEETIKLQRAERKIDPNKPPEEPKEEPKLPAGHGHGGDPSTKKKEEPKFEWWILGDKKVLADEAGINSITSNLSNLNAKSYADKIKDEDRGLDKPSAKVTLKTLDGKEYSLTFGKQTGDEVVLQAGENPEVYIAYKYVLENVQKDLAKKEEVKDTTVAPITPLVPPAEPKTAPPIPSTPVKKDEKPVQVIPAVPGGAVKDETKPALPPAVVKPPEEKK